MFVLVGMCPILLFLFLTTSLCGSEIKKVIKETQAVLSVVENQSKKSALHYKLARAYSQDQEEDKAFEHFLLAIDNLPLKPHLAMCKEEEKIYQRALEDYAYGEAKALIKKYKNYVDEHPNWHHLNLLIATAFANLRVFDDFFVRFYHAYPYLSETFLAYKTRGILFLKLSERNACFERREMYKKQACCYLVKALELNPKEASLYKVLIFLAKDAKNDGQVMRYLQKMCKHGVSIKRSDIYFYVSEAVLLGDAVLGQKIVDLARSQYEFSRGVLEAQEFLNQCGRG